FRNNLVGVVLHAIDGDHPRVVVWRAPANDFIMRKRLSHAIGHVDQIDAVEKSRSDLRWAAAADKQQTYRSKQQVKGNCAWGRQAAAHRKAHIARRAVHWNFTS